MADHVRAMTIRIDATGEPEQTRAVELSPDALVYAVSISSTTGARLQLQDSALEVFTGETPTVPIVWPMTGLRWPAFARFIVPAGGIATLRVIYGNCDVYK